MMRTRAVVAISLFGVALSMPVAGQSPAPVPAKLVEPLAPASAYVYQPDARRDPFVSLLVTGGDLPELGKRPEGPAGMTVEEVSVRGVMQSRGALIAMVQGPDHKTYVVHQGDKFFDGTIRSIATWGLVVVQDVHDPLQLVKQREIRKLLRSLEETKEQP